MASYSASRAVHATLAASTVDTVTLTLTHPRIEILNRGTGDIFLTVDGSTPTVGGNDTFVVPSNGVGFFPNPFLAEPGLAGGPQVPGRTVVNLISTGTPAYSVTGD
jgi:hypothetical protein